MQRHPDGGRAAALAVAGRAGGLLHRGRARPGRLPCRGRARRWRLRGGPRGCFPPLLPFPDACMHTHGLYDLCFPGRPCRPCLKYVNMVFWHASIWRSKSSFAYGGRIQCLDVQTAACKVHMSCGCLRHLRRRGKSPVLLLGSRGALTPRLCSLQGASAPGAPRFPACLASPCSRPRFAKVHGGRRGLMPRQWPR